MPVAPTRTYTVVVAVCHPDDEALWLGGLLSSLGSFNFLQVFVVALTGASSPRAAEFQSARSVAGYTAGVVLGEDVPPWGEPLPPVGQRLESGMLQLGIARDGIDALITHSPYGDEHRHPHHRQAYRELFRWSRDHGIPFGYASCAPMLFFNHRPLLRNLRRRGVLHLSMLARCTPAYSRLRRAMDPVFRNYLQCPKYYVQFQTDPAAKMAMLERYESIDIARHVAGYAAATNACEGLYLFDDRALAPFRAVIESMEAPGGENLFTLADLRLRLKSFLRRIRD